MGLANVTTFRLILGLPDDSQDAANEVFVNAAEAAVRNSLGRDIEKLTYPAAPSFGNGGDSGYYSGSGTRFLILRQRPVWSISSLWLDPTGRFGQNPDGSFATGTLLVAGTDYELRYDGCLPGTSTPCSNSGMVERIGSVWTPRVGWRPGTLIGQEIDGGGNIKIAYTAGYANPPADIVSAIYQVAAFIRRNAKRGGMIQSESLGSYSYSLGQAAVAGQYPELGSVRGALAPYREQAV